MRHLNLFLMDQLLMRAAWLLLPDAMLLWFMHHPNRRPNYRHRYCYMMAERECNLKIYRNLLMIL